ncbi:hypothetical protein [Pseudonocardia dioxanivorans]|uniref:hypothetical protein n=1 Tax=Pseudonocardia dioxanivorans TaxID=240495 RepID=UPI0002F002BC|nr:hypothetical protein [Pseudonocardia dioxanivorans]
MLDPRLPAPFARELAADDNEGFTIALLTVADGGWPHQALISVGEIVALDDVRLRLATWPASTATRNLLATGRATLVAVVDAEVFAVRVEVAPRESGLELQVFDGRVVEARSDTAPYATVESGIRFRLHDPAAVSSRWRATRSALRSLG